MLCTHCSEPIKPVVAIDIDGTLGDYHSHFIQFAEAYFGLPELPITYDGAGSFKRWFTTQYPLTDKDWHDVKLAYRQGGMKRTMPIYPHAQYLVSTVYRNNAELWVTTTRPYLSLDSIVPDTVEWLNRHAINFDGMLFDEDKYAQLVKRVDRNRIVAVVDDLPEMCVAADEAVGKAVAIMAATQYNSACVWPSRIPLWNIADEIAHRIESWRLIHA